MLDDPLEGVFAMVERAFIRLQAGDVLVLCLEEEDTAPMQKLVEGLVLAGPQSLNALREIRAEVASRKTEFRGEIARVFTKLENDLKEYGLCLPSLPNRVSMHSLEPKNFRRLMDQQGFLESEHQKECAQLLNTSKEVMSQLARQILLLEEVEFYLEDWIWGLMYQLAHQVGAETMYTAKKVKYCQ